MRLINAMIMMILFLIMISSCAQVRSVSQTSIPSQRKKIVRAEVKKNIFFFFNFSTDYLNDLNKLLRKKCPKGNIEGILTKDVTIVYFPIIYHQDKVTAEGFCVE